MNIIKFENFIRESNASSLKYMSFDWDDNILHMGTLIHMQKRSNDNWINEDVSTSKFATVRNDKVNWRLLNNSPDDAFSEFRDGGPRGKFAFIEDTKNAIKEKKFAPSWAAFIDCLTKGSIFSIITARGHHPETLRKGVEYIINNVLDKDQKYLMYNNCLLHSYIFDKKDFDRIPKNEIITDTPLIREYLSNCDFYGVSSPEFLKEFNAGDAANPEEAKKMALDKFINKCSRFGNAIGAKSVSVSFSDDDSKNISHVQKFFKEKSALSTTLPHNLKLNVFDTSDRTISGGKKSDFDSRLESNQSNQSAGMASSVLPFTQFTHDMSNQSAFSNRDNVSSTLANKQIQKMTKEIFKGKRRKKKKVIKK